MADNSVVKAEPRIGYNTLQMAANQGLQGLQGLGSTDSPAAGYNNGYGYLDYFDYTDNNYNSKLATNTNQQYYANLLRRRNGLLNAAGGLAGLGGLSGQRQLKTADAVGLASSGYGHSGYGGGGHSGYGGGGGYGGPVSVVSGYGPSQQCEQGINPLLALLTLAGAAVGFYFIYIKLTMSGRRSFQSDAGGALENIAEMLWIGNDDSFESWQQKSRSPIFCTVFLRTTLIKSVFSGLEEFEDKVDKIANGQEDDSWIGQLYNQFSSSLGIDGAKVDDADLGSKDGLEPPILDETWGLEDIQKLHAEEDGKLRMIIDNVLDVLPLPIFHA